MYRYQIVNFLKNDTFVSGIELQVIILILIISDILYFKGNVKQIYRVHRNTFDTLIVLSAVNFNSYDNGLEGYSKFHYIPISDICN